MMNNNTNQQNDYQSKLDAFYDNEDKNQLEQLRQKYSTVPNYKNMSLRDELQTRFDLKQMNNLEQKFGQEESRCISPRLAYKTPQPKRFSTGEIVSDGVKGFGQGVEAIFFREKDIALNLPSRLNSLVATTSNFLTNYNVGMNSNQNYMNEDAVSPHNSTLENAINYWQQYNIDTQQNLSDINKHQHMSCLAGKDGLLSGMAGLGLGVTKEVFDLVTKLTNTKKREAYGGAKGVWQDSIKDMNNNIKGFNYGFVENKPCYELLRNPLP